MCKLMKYIETIKLNGLIVYKVRNLVFFALMIETPSTNIGTRQVNQRNFKY